MYRDEVATHLDKRKGVISQVEKPENMPVDKNGNRADIVMDDNSVISRMNLGVLYRQYIGAALRDVSQEVRKMLNLPQMSHNKAIKAVGDLYKTNPELVLKAHNYALGFFKITSEDQYEFCKNLSPEQIVEYTASAVAKGYYLYYPVENQKEPVDIIENIQAQYPPVYGPITYTDNSGRRVVTKKPIRIGPLHWMVLDKIADGWASVASGKLQHFGVLSPLSKHEKYSRPWHNSPVRTSGETECRIYAGYCGREAIAELMDRNNSPTTHEQVVKSIMSSVTPGNIDQAIDRSALPLGGAKPLQLIRHFSMCSGWRNVYVPENRFKYVK